MKARKSKKVFTLLLLMGLMFILPNVSIADETTFIIEIDGGERRDSSLMDTAERLLDHDRQYMQLINQAAKNYDRVSSGREKVLKRLNYVEVRTLHLKGWIFGIKKLIHINDKIALEIKGDNLFLEGLRSPRGRDELDGLYIGVNILLFLSKNDTIRNSGLETKLKHLTDQVLLMEVCEYYRLMDDINSLRRVKRAEKELNTAFNKNLVFLSQELKHLKDWYVEHARQG